MLMLLSVHVTSVCTLDTACLPDITWHVTRPSRLHICILVRYWRWQRTRNEGGYDWCVACCVCRCSFFVRGFLVWILRWTVGFLPLPLTLQHRCVCVCVGGGGGGGGWWLWFRSGTIPVVHTWSCKCVYIIQSLVSSLLYPLPLCNHSSLSPSSPSFSLCLSSLPLFIVILPPSLLLHVSPPLSFLLSPLPPLLPSPSGWC